MTTERLWSIRPSASPNPPSNRSKSSHPLPFRLSFPLTPVSPLSRLHASQKGLTAVLKRGIDDVVDNRENNLPPGAKGSLSSRTILYLVLLAVAVFVVLPLGSVCVICGCAVLAWCNSRAKDKTDCSGEAAARSCLLLVAEEENEHAQRERQQGGDEDREGGDEEQGRAGRRQTGGGGNGGDSSEGSDVDSSNSSGELARKSRQSTTIGGGDSSGGSDVDGSSSSSGELARRSRQSTTTSSGTGQAGAGFDFFLNGWGFCCPSRKGCCCVCGNKRAPLLGPSSPPSPPLSPPPSCVDSRRPALLSIKPSKELRAVRLIQLLKFADSRAHTYLSEPCGQELLSGLELRPPLPPGRGSPRGLDGPFQ